MTPLVYKYVHQFLRGAGLFL